MASTGGLRRFGKRPAEPGRFRLPEASLAAAVAAGLAATLLLGQLAGRQEQNASPAHGFLTSALGASDSSASLVRKPEPNVTLRLDARGARFSRAGTTVGISLANTSGRWRRHLRGATRRTPFGQEAVVFRGAYGVEHFARVERRQGSRTWSWTLETPRLTPRLAPDGGVDLYRVWDHGESSAGVRIQPVAIFDDARRNITPDGLTWDVARSGTAWSLSLTFDDSALPLPYVIDPNIARTAVTTALASPGTSIAPALPGGSGDVLIAQIAVRNNATINAPAGWSAVGAQQNSGTGLTQRIFSATWAAGLSTTFTWTGSVNAAAAISAYSDVHPSSPVIAASAGSGSGTTATAPSVTATFNDSMVIPMYSVQGNSTATQDAGQGVTEHYSTVTASGAAAGRIRITGADGLQAGAGATGAKTATTTNSAWAAHLVALRREPPDGGGTASTGTTNVAASSTGNTLVWTYTAPADGLAAGEVRLTVPTGWSAPSATGSGAGYTTLSGGGLLSFSAQTIVVSNLTLGAGATITITYGSTASGGPGATASAATGSVTWAAQQRGTAAGTLTDLAAQPAITQVAANGSGSLTTPTTDVSPNSAGNTITFTYTAASGGMSDGAISIDVPTGWSPPSTTGTAAGFVTSTAGTVGVAGQTITVSGLTLAAGATVDVVYGATSGGGPGATSPSTSGPQMWQARQRSVATGALTDLAASPSISVDASDGAGSIAPLSATVGYASTGNTLSFTYTAAASVTDGAVSIDVPTGWSTPSTTGADAGYSTSTAGSLAVGGQTITISGLNLASGGTFDIVYGSTTGGGPGATAPASAGSATWTAKQRSTAGGTLTDLSASPSVTVAAQPAAPSGLGTTPSSPANDTSPDLTGSAPAGSTVRIYASADCSGGVAASGTAAAFGGAGITVAVSDNATTSLSATATDAQGGVSACSSPISYTADSVAPAAPSGLSVAPASPANDNDPRVSGTADAGTTVALYASADCSGTNVSGTAATFGSGGLDPANVADNSSTTYTAIATDAAGNTSLCSAPVTYVEDSTDPATAVTFPLSGESYRSATWSNPTGTASDSGGAGLARVELSLRRVSTGLYWDGSAFVDGTENWRTAAGTASWSLTFPASNFPADGDYVVRVRAVDDAANAETALSYTITYDDAAPDTTITAQPSDPSSSNDPSFSFSADESGSSFECRLDGGSWSPCTSPEAYTDLADGDHSFDVRATDAAGNVDTTPASYDWTIDTAAPNTSITGQPSDPTNDNDPSFSFTSSESGSTFECRLDGGSWSPCTSPEAYTDLADGDHSFDVRATDAPGNTDATPAGHTWTIDTGAPSSVASFPVNLGSYNAAGWDAGCSPSGICGTASDGGAGLDRVEVSIRRSADGLYWDGSAFASASEDWRAATGTAAWSLALDASAFPADGSYTVRVRASDDAGNVEAPASRTFTVDSNAPQSQIDSGPADPTNDQDATFAFSADEAGSSFECRLDGGSWSACTSPHEETGLGAGPHTLDVRATDTAGNVDASPATTSWTIDLAAPSSTIAFPAEAGSYNATGWADPSGTASDAVSLDSVEISLRQVSSGLYWDGSDFSDGSENWRSAAGTTSWSFAFPAAAFPADGDYALRVRARDAAGNVGAPSSRTFTVDTVAPETTIDSGPSGATNDDEASFAFSASQLGSTFECRLDGGSWSTCTSPRDLSGLAQGPHTFDVRATDGGGNTDATPASRSWTVDTVPPSASMTAPPAGSYVGETVTLTADASDAGGTGVAGVAFEKSAAGAGSWSPVPATWVTGAGDDGLYDLRVVVTDNAGNVTTSAPATNVRVDNTPPSAVMDDPGPAVTGTVALAHSSTDSGSGVDPASVQFEYRQLPAGAWTPTSASWDTALLGEGDYELRVTVEDRAGNAATSAPVTTIVDNTAPTVEFTVPTDSGYVNALSVDPLTLVADAADGGSGVDEVEFFVCDDPACAGETSLGSDDTGPYEASWPLPGSDGAATLKVVARDRAGHEAESVISVTVDRTVPDTTLLTNPGDPSNNATPAFGFSSSEPGTFECRVDGGLWSPCASPHTEASLADGTHTFEVRAVDDAGNVDASAASWTWLVDTTAPTATMDDPGDNLRLLVNLASTQSDPGGAAASGIASVQYEYSVAGANTWVATPAAWDTPTVADGLYDLRVVVTDVAGNVTQSTPVANRRVDNAPPATAVDDPGANLRSTVTLGGSASDAGSGVLQVVFEISPDGASWSTVGIAGAEPYQVSFDTATMPDGLYFFRTVATDVAGNITESAAVGPRRIDNTLPTATMNDPGANLRGTVSLSSVTDDPPGPPVASGVSSVVYEALIGGTWTGISQTWATTTVADGVYDLRVVATDVAGNQAISNAVAGRRVDNTAPSTGHNAPAGWQSSGVTVSLGPSDGGSGIANTQFSVDGGGWNSGTTVNVAGDGIHTISFFSTDVAGNVESPQTATVMIDTTPPDPGANDPGNYLSGTVQLTANPDTGGGGAEVTEVEFQHRRSSEATWATIAVDTTDAANPPYTATWATTPADDGSWDLRFIVRDEAGNENTADLGSKIVDNTAPTGSLASPLGGSTVSGNVSLGVSANDDNPIASVAYFVDGGSVGSSSSAPYQVVWNSASSGDGSHSIHAVITDMAGHSTTTGGVTVTVDNFAPTVTLGAVAANVSGSVALTASPSGDTVQVTFERRPAGGGGWTAIGTAVGPPWTATFDTTAVPDGLFELRAIAVDAGSNSGWSGAVGTRVDNSAPTGLLTKPGGGAVVGGTVALEATASDPGSGSGVAGVTWQARSGGGGFADVASAGSAPYAGSWTVGGLPSGAYELRILVTDNAGNAFASAPISLTVDATPPTVALDDPGALLSGTVALSASTTGDATSVTFARSPAGAAAWTTIGSDGTAPWGASLDTAVLNDGLYDLRAVVTDAVGNTSASVRSGVRVDNLVPIVGSSVPAHGSIVASASQITITATEDIDSLTSLELDGAPAVAPTISGKTATFNTGALAEGSHTLSGTVHDAAGRSTSFAITFFVGVPTAPAPSTGGGSFADVLPGVPAPTDFRGVIEGDGTMSLRWTPARDGAGEPHPTVLFVDDVAVRTFAPGDDEVNLGAFDPADMRTFSLASIDASGRLSSTTARLRSTSQLAGKTLDEAAAVLANRGFQLGNVAGEGSVVVAPATVRLVELGSKVDLTLGEPNVRPQARLVFSVVGTKRYAPTARKFIAIRLQSTRDATATAALLAPRGQRLYRWRLAISPGTAIRRLIVPPHARSRPGRYRLVFTVQSGRDVVKRTIVVRVLPRQLKKAKPDRRQVEVVLAGGSGIERDVAAGVGRSLRVTATQDEDAWTLTGSEAHNVQVVLVDVDRFGLRLVRELRLVFPSIRILALTNDPRRLAQSVRAGATLAVPRSTPPRDIAKLIVQLAKRAPY